MDGGLWNKAYLRLIVKYFIISGEASGDLHAGNLLTALKRLDPQAEAQAWGGESLTQAGATVLKHYRDLAFMGFVEVIRHLPEIWRNFAQCKAEITAFHPHAIILVDYPGFNLRMAGWAKQQGYKVFYYISPQVWAWKSSRVKLIRRYVDLMLCILPFEVEFFARYGVKVDFVGHPLLDELSAYKPEAWPELNSVKPIIALLPGSRQQEIEKVLPIMLQLPTLFPAYQFMVAGTNQIHPGIYHSLIGTNSQVQVVFGKTRQLLAIAHAACVTSGTATLETGLLEVPQVVCYRGNWLSYQIARRLIKVKFISLVNLVLDKQSIRELIQDDLKVDTLSSALQDLLRGPRRTEIIEDYRRLKKRLGGPGASSRAAELINRYLKS